MICMLATHQDRPRELRWFHAGPMLYGDWGTSRFYVLGLAFYYALHASFFYVLGVCALVAAVGWAYTIICRCYPDGGGVYSAAKHTSRVLAVVGALLLFADYIITASLSALDGMHYLGIPDQWVPICAISAIVLVGIINYIGPKKAGTFALVVALATLALTIVLFLFSIPHVAEGWRNIHRPTEPLGHQWLMLVNVVLALSGVEAIANMTGIMVQPVEKTSKKAIWPVLLEVVIFNLIFAVAMNALPTMPGVHVGSEPAYQKDARREAAHSVVELQDHGAMLKLTPEAGADVKAYREDPHAPELNPTPDEEKIKNTVLRFMGEKFIGSWFAKIAGFVFGLLLLSAVNTAVADMISIQYVMSRDTELPRWFTKLNMFGVPWIALLPAVLLPVGILCFVTDLEKLADLYAIGVVGAIGINLGSCTINMTMPLKWWERAGMGLLALIMAAIEGTLAYQKPHALYFAGSVLILGLAMRFVTKTFPAMRQKARKQVGVSRYRGIEVPAEAAPTTEVLAPDMSRPTILVATRGGQPLLEFAVDYARDINANLFVLYVRRINIAGGPVADLTLDDDAEAQRVLQAAKELCRRNGVRIMPIYVVSSDVAYSILDFAATYNVKALLMGVSRKATLLRALQGDVLTEVAEQLPNTIPLLIHA